MKLLVDACRSPGVAAQLRHAAFDAVHVRDVGLVTASDETISAYARSQNMIVVAADSDFATLVALSTGTAPSIVLLRSADGMSPSEQAAVLAVN